MMNLQKLIAYDEWANQKIFDVLNQMPSGEKKAESCRLFSHLLSAQQVWISRITSAGEKPPIWPELSMDELEHLVNANPEDLKSVAEKSDKIISYSNSAGKTFNNSTEEILMHLIIHGQHHRAQIATLIRKSGLTPPATDLIVYLRSNS